MVGRAAGLGIRRRAASSIPVNKPVTTSPDDCGVRPPGMDADPDGAVVRAGLVRNYGARHGLWQLDLKCYFRSVHRLPPALRGFEVPEQLASTSAGCARCRRWIAGQPEILVRGVVIDPDALCGDGSAAGQQTAG